MAANTADLIKQIEFKSSKFRGLPLGSADESTGSTFLKTIVQYLQVSQEAGFMSTLPEDVSYFFTQSPKDPALGNGFAMSRIGRTFAWIQPSIKVGEQYKHLKPPKIPVYENKDRADIKLQCSTAIATQEFLEFYNQPEVPNKIVDMILNHSTSAINNTITEFWQFFWINLICAGTNKFVFDKATLPYFSKKLTGNSGKDSKNLLQDYQEAMEPEFKKFQERAQRIKNFKWYNPALYADWIMKAQNAKDIDKVEKPSNLGNDHKSFVKALYTQGGNSKKTPDVTREQSIYAMLHKLRRTISELTSTQPRFNNHVAYDTGAVDTENTEYQLCKCSRSDLIIVLSEWDYDDLVSGASFANPSSRSLKLGDITEGIKVIKVYGIPPGFAYVGEKWVLNMFMRLNHSGQLFHWREEETQYYTNVWFAFATFTDGICGAVIAPAKNFTAPGEFYEEYAGDLE